MKVLILSKKQVHPPTDGESMAVYTLGKSLEYAGAEVVWFSLDSSGKSLTGLRYDEEKQGYTMPINTAVASHFFSYQRKYPLQVRRFYNAEAASSLQEVVGNYEPDIIQIESVFLATYIEGLRKISHAPIILRLHNIEEEIWQNRLAGVRGLHYALYQKMANDIRRFERVAWSSADLVLPISHADKELVLNNCPEVSTEVIPMGMVVDHIARPNRIMGGGLRLGLIASWDWSPNLEAAKWLLDEIVPQLDVLDNWTLHLAGRNMPGWLIKRRSKRIHILGEVKSALHFVRSMDVMVMPFKSGGGVRVKVLEALAAGIPCIGTSKAFQGLSVTDNNEVLIAEDAEQFVEAVCRISSEEGLWNRLRKRGMHNVDQYHNPSTIGEALYEKYSNGIDKKY
tara:strand:- start:867 stop:2054 length:1188 start_codon:yes stop_codon:yes gene_type:complete